ncbi:hypothetical protein [Hansschlegelia zhihuaiae]|uniref:Secreted protein n=1 Tax=Hansschlegelia zhihuaiae TaxID=405005 RepID=A0A4Q0MJ48_9HYPH|nr:hypothetical protein [Hansschlegelia zhihuaiae]RXF73574.1 hypothetical protein EK403_10315 [Hansschlegelia zhihuaiae]
MRTVLLVGAMAAAALSSAPPVHAADAADYRYRETRTVVRDRSDAGVVRGYTGQLPACGDPEVERRIVHNFSDTERTYWRTGLELSPFVRPVELGYRPWGWSFIPRRFCKATTVTNDGRKRQVSYSIREWQSWGSLSWGVEWCVSGLDRHYSYAPDCKMARP